MISALKKAFDARGLQKKDLCGVPGLCYSLARRHYTGEKNLTARYAVIYERLFGIPRAELRPDLWPAPDPITLKPSAINAQETTQNN